jgi:hypothetical protein
MSVSLVNSARALTRSTGPAGPAVSDSGGGARGATSDAGTGVLRRAPDAAESSGELGICIRCIISDVVCGIRSGRPSHGDLRY